MNNQAITIKKKSAGKNILLTALLAGTLDALGAIIVYNVNPERMFKHIASGAIGKEIAFSGGMEIVLLGIAIHYFIASSWTTLFFVGYRKSKIQSIPWPLAGILYGAVIWVCMNLVVLPHLSTIPMPDFTFAGVAKGMSILIVMIGLPVSFMANRFYKITG